MMNDFTKEELEKIYGCIDLFTEGADSREEQYQPLLNKIQSMIDNYGQEKVRVRGQERNISEFVKEFG